LIHFYGQDEQWVLGLTGPEFNARVKDVFEITKMFGGEGKGRITRTRHESIQDVFRKKGLTPPKHIKGKSD